MKDRDLFPRATVCGIVTQYRQFSWYNDHKINMPKDPMDWEKYIYKLYSINKLEMEAWRRCFQLAMMHYLYLYDNDSSQGSNHYMTVEMFIKRGHKPFYNTRIVSIIGKHIFFKSIQGG